MEAMILQGLALGLTDMCFTEHNDFDFPYIDGQEGTFLLNTDSYLYDLLRLQNQYRNRIRIHFGVELGVQPMLSERLAAYTKAYDFDFVIASSHACNGKDPFYPAFFEGRTEAEAYGEYFSCVLENLYACPDFDVCGHLDYVVRYGPGKNTAYSYSQYADCLDEILKFLIGSGKGLELNTGGFRCELGEPNPSSAILHRYKELGGELITVGSDAHTPSCITEYFDKACSLLKEIGFRYYCIYEKRMPRFFPLT